MKNYEQFIKEDLRQIGLDEDGEKTSASKVYTSSKYDVLKNLKIMFIMI